jgi:hypothetical protein
MRMSIKRSVLLIMWLALYLVYCPVILSSDQHRSIPLNHYGIFNTDLYDGGAGRGVLMHNNAYIYIYIALYGCAGDRILPGCPAR